MQRKLWNFYFEKVWQNFKDFSDQSGSGQTTPSEHDTPCHQHEKFQPMFSVAVSLVERGGNTLVVSIKTTEESKGLEECCVKREYEDFESLNQSVITNNNIDGIVLPPLPAKPVGDISKPDSEFGESSDLSPTTAHQFQRFGRSLEKYLQALVNHPLLGCDDSLKTFLTVAQPLSRTKVKKGIFGKLFSAVEEARKANHRDIDEYFQRERDWSNGYADNMKELSANFSKVVHSKRKICSAYGHLATSLSMGNSFLLQSENNQNANSVLVSFSQVLEAYKRCCEDDATNDEDTVGFHVDLATRYADALKEMHYRRTCLLIAYEDANKSLSKAKPNKMEAAEEAKLAAERAFEKCSEVASKEIVLFHRQRAVSFQDCLVQHAEKSIQGARDSHALLSKLISSFKRLEV